MKPLNLERHYWRAQNQLKDTYSHRHHFIIINDFLQKFSVEVIGAESYLLEIIPHVPEFKEFRDCSGLDPYLLHQLRERLYYILERAKLQEVKTLANNAVGKIEYPLMIQNLWLGNLNEAVSLAADLTNAKYFNVGQFDWDAIDGASEKYPKERLSKLLEGEYPIPEEVEHLLRRVYQEWESHEQSGDGITVNVPVILKDGINGSQFFLGGKLQSYYLSNVKKVTKGWGSLEFGFVIPKLTKAEDKLNSHRLIKAVRSWIEQYYYKHDAIPHIKGQLNVGDSDFFQVGRSDELAIAVLLAATTINESHITQNWCLNSSVAISGCIDQDGAVAPVSSDTIKQKIEVTFFSWCHTLLVPKQQEEEAHKFVDELHLNYPRKQLSIKGIRNINEVFSDRRVTHLDDPPTIIWAGRRLWDFKGAVTGWMTALLLLIGLFYLVFSPLDTNPVMADFKGTNLIVKNSNGYVLKKIKVNQRTAEKFNNNNFKPAAEFIDINGDRTNEVFWLNFGTRKYDTTTVNAFDIKSDEYLWTTPLIYNVNYPEHDYIQVSTWNPIQLIKGEFERSLYVVGHQPTYFPGYVQDINAETGDINQRYIHPGYFYDTTMYDLNGDGKKELIAGGTSNAYLKGVLVILDPDFLHGESLTTEEYRLKDYSDTEEMAYLKLPLTPIGKLTPGVTQPSVRKVDILEEKELIKMVIKEGEINNSDVNYFLYLSFDLRVARFGTSSNYDQRIRNYINQGKLTEESSNSILKSFADDILYWNGFEWQQKPTYNAAYFDSLGLNSESLGFNISKIQ